MSLRELVGGGGGKNTLTLIRNQKQIQVCEAAETGAGVSPSLYHILIILTNCETYF